MIEKCKEGPPLAVVEDVITTGRSSLECEKLIKKAGGKVIGFSCIIDRTSNKTLKIKHLTSNLNFNI